MRYSVTMTRIGRRHGVTFELAVPGATPLAETDPEELAFQVHRHIRRNKLMASSEFSVHVELDGIENKTASVSIDGGRFGEGTLVELEGPA